MIINEKCLCVLAYSLHSHTYLINKCTHGYECLAPRLREVNFKYISFINVAYSSQTLYVLNAECCVHI